MVTQSRRGRPKGTGINDQTLLIEIASILLANPDKKRTTAIKDVGISDPSVIRRLRDKYQAQEHELVAAARALLPKGSRKTATPQPVAETAAVATRTPAQRADKKAKSNSGKTQKPASPAPAVAHLNGKTSAHADVQPVAHAVVAEAAQTHVHVAQPSATDAPVHSQATHQPAAATATPAPVPAAAVKTATATDPLSALFEGGFSIEALVSQFIGQVLGMDANEIKNSPIPALIRQQAQLADLILPLLAGQFQGSRSAKAA